MYEMGTGILDFRLGTIAGVCGHRFFRLWCRKRDGLFDHFRFVENSGAGKPHKLFGMVQGFGKSSKSAPNA
jgi:hypothetical protein